MTNIKWFTAAFEKIDDKKEIKVIECLDQNNFKEYILNNARVTNNSFKYLKKYLGSTRFSVENIDGSSKIAVKISKVKMPNKNYQILPYLVSNIDMLKENGSNFLGIGEFGEEFLDMSKIIHLGIFGASGYGKSSLIRFLLTQTLIFRQDSLNILLDFKGNEFKSFDSLNHPNILAHVHGMAEMKFFSDFLGIELAKREYYFANSFEIAPTTLQEYNQYKTEYNADNLPIFNQIFIWVDEGKGFLEAMAQIGMDNDQVVKFINRCRSFGLNFIFSSQSYSDFGWNNCKNLSHIITFYSPADYKTADVLLDIGERTRIHTYETYGKNVDETVPGRITFIDIQNSSAKIMQVPELSSHDCLALIDQYSNKLINRKSLYSQTTIDPQLFGSLEVMRYLSENNTYEQLMTYNFLNFKSFSKNTGGFLTHQIHRSNDIVKLIAIGSNDNPFREYYKFESFELSNLDVETLALSNENEIDSKEIISSIDELFEFIDSPVEQLSDDLGQKEIESNESMAAGSDRMSKNLLDNK